MEDERPELDEGKGDEQQVRPEGCHEERHWRAERREPPGSVRSPEGASDNSPGRQAWVRGAGTSNAPEPRRGDTLPEVPPLRGSVRLIGRPVEPRADALGYSPAAPSGLKTRRSRRGR